MQLPDLVQLLTPTPTPTPTPSGGDETEEG